jgi:hypothetical protein
MLITLHLCVLCGSQNKQYILPYTSLTDWFLLPKCRAFTARYGLSPYVTQICFVFKGLNVINVYSRTHWPRGQSLGLRPLACWDCGFESSRGNGCLSVCCECCVLSGKGLCDGLITRPEKSCRLCVYHSLSVIGCNNKPLHLQLVGRKRSD